LAENMDLTPSRQDFAVLLAIFEIARHEAADATLPAEKLVVAAARSPWSIGNGLRVLAYSSCSAIFSRINCCASHLFCIIMTPTHLPPDLSLVSVAVAVAGQMDRFLYFSLGGDDFSPDGETFFAGEQ
jgi:hypothetical protein